MRSFGRALLPLIVWSCSALPLAAQEADDGLAALRAKGALTDEDRAAVREWVRERVTLVSGNDAAAAQQAFGQLRAGVSGGREFRDAYVLACVEVIGSVLKTTPLAPATRLMTLVSGLDDLRTFEVLLAALQDERTAVRATAAVGLRRLQSKLTGNADALGKTLDALREAGKKESSPGTLQLIYRALSYADAASTADRKASATALLAVLDERVKQIAGEKLRAEGADHVGLQAVWALQNALDEAVRKQYAAVLARLLQYGVRRYTGGESPLWKVNDKTGGADAIALRNGIEQMILEAEKQLTTILSPPDAPKVADRMQKADPAQMAVEMNRWAALVKTALGLELEDVQRPAPPEEGEEKPGPP